jgi:hypothetical protein
MTPTDRMISTFIDAISEAVRNGTGSTLEGLVQKLYQNGYDDGFNDGVFQAENFPGPPEE